jgi:hypothetical protein
MRENFVSRKKKKKTEKDKGKPAVALHAYRDYGNSARAREYGFVRRVAT